jgi:amino acid adenylation domain-containing protein
MSLHLLHDLFEKCAINFPDRTAVVFEDRQVSYHDLHEKSNQLAQVILKCAPNEDIIAISTTRCIEMIVGVLAILKAGKTYLPIDPKYPHERQFQMVKISCVKYVIAGKDEANNWGRLGLTRIDYHTKSTASQCPQIKPNEVYAVFFTSGSTGVPKGVKVTHEGALGLIQHKLNHSKAAGVGIKTLQFCHLGFDVSVKEIFVTLSTGGELHLMNELQRMDAYFLLEYVHQQHIQTVFLPPVALQYFSAAAQKANIYPASLIEISTGGELLKISSAIRNFFKHSPQCRLINNYGPTEASIWVSDLVLSSTPEEWPDLPSIGFPMENHASFYVLDEKMNPVANGGKGELYIAGTALVKGYLKRDDLTNDRFIHWSAPEGTIQRLYKTGDWVSPTENGDFIFFGREDDQIKIRGNRVELGEIEVALSKVPQINQAIVKLEEIQDEKSLVAYLVLNDQANLDLKNIKFALKAWIPEFMIPDHYVVLHDFPKTNSGKVDRKALKRPEVLASKSQNDNPTSDNASLFQILTVFREVLLQPELGPEDNFFDYGGNSLKAQQTVALLKERYQLNVPVILLYQAPTAASLVDTQTSSYIQPELTNQLERTQKSVAIISMAFRFPGANDPQEMFELLKNGEEKIQFFEENELEPSLALHKRNHPNYVKAKGIIEGYDEFDADFFDFSTKLAAIADPQIRKFLEVSYEALEKVGYRKSKKSMPIGVFAGSGNNTYLFHHLMSQPELLESFGDFQVNSLNEKDYLASRVAYHLDLTGPAVSVNSACSTALLAVSQAFEAIRNGSCHMALAGAASIQSPVKAGHLYEEGAVLSKDGRVRAFDKNATGTLFSDGVGVVLLKDLEQAKKDGDIILAVIKGVGVNNDGRMKSSFSAPSILGQADAIKRALQDAEISSAQVSYVEAHATATPLGDPIEIQGLKLAFSGTEMPSECALGSVKSNLGHLNAAAGMAGLIKTVLSLQHQVWFPQAGFEVLNPEIQLEDSPFFINTQFQPWVCEGTRIAGVSAFGVGGTNVHVILEEALKQEVEPLAIDELPAYVLPISAKSIDSLQGFNTSLDKFLSVDPNVSLLAVAQSLHQRPDYSFRSYLVANEKEDLNNQLKLFPIAVQISKQLKKPVFLFPGQGAQFINMGKALYAHVPAFKKAVDDCENILQEIGAFSMRKLIFFESSTSADELKLKETQFAQPALFVIEYALAQTWKSLGVIPAYLCGHSIGEFAAAHLAGIFDLKDALTLVVERGKLMGRLAKGKMLAISCSEDEVMSMLPSALSLAAVNRRNQCVVSGPEEEINDFKNQLNAQSLIHQELKTSHAFHSSMMDDMLEEFQQVVESMPKNAPSLPMISSLTGKELTKEEALSSKYWVDQLRHTVRFADAAQQLCELEQDLFFMEMGPGNVLTHLIKQATGYRQQKTYACVMPSATYGDFLKTIAEIWQNGQTIHWEALYKQMAPKVTLPGYAFKKQKLWIDAPVAAEKQSLIAVHEKPEIAPELLELDEPQEIDPRVVLKNKIKYTLEMSTGVRIEDEKTTFFELGLDSLLLTAMLTSIKKAFDVPLTFRQLNEDLCDFERLEAYLSDYYSAIGEPMHDDQEERGLQPEEVLVECEKVLHQSMLPPVPGAKLGKDQNGQMAWFVRDHNNPGKFLKVNSNI